jgi:hypothetical protein
LHRARWGEKTGEIVVEIVQDGGRWLRHRLYLVPGVLLGGLEHYQELWCKNFNFLVLMCFPPRSSSPLPATPINIRFFFKIELKQQTFPPLTFRFPPTPPPPDDRHPGGRQGHRQRHQHPKRTPTLRLPHQKTSTLHRHTTVQTWLQKNHTAVQKNYPTTCWSVPRGQTKTQTRVRHFLSESFGRSREKKKSTTTSDGRDMFSVRQVVGTGRRQVQHGQT